MITLHENQSEIYEDLFVNKSCRWSVVVCSRGFGKSYLAAVCAISAIFELLELDASVPNKTVYIIAPTYDQVTDIYFPLINYDLGMEDYAIKSSKEMGRFVFGKGVELRLLSYESVERLRGKGSYMVIWDEIESCKKGIKPQQAWQAVIQPTITTRWSRQRSEAFGAKSPGRALFIGTPKGYGYLYDLYNMKELNPSWKSYHYDYTASPFLDIEEIEALKHSLDPVEFASEYLASFAESGNNVFYCFDRIKHVKNDLPDFYPPEFKGATMTAFGEDVHVCLDFNVGIQASSFFAIRGGQIHILDEFKGHPDTESLAKSITTKYKGHKIYAYPDPSGRSRKTSAPIGTTDFTILKSHGIICLAHKKAPAIVDSVAAVNRKLLTAAGDIDLYIRPECTGVITSLERTKWVNGRPDTATIDKTEGIEHFSDGIRYGVEFLFPVLRQTQHVVRGFGF